MSKQLVLVLVAMVLGVILTKEFWPSKEAVQQPVPIITTVHDTVRDTVRLVGPKRVTTDTVQLVIRETIHDTVQINVGPVVDERPLIWPVLNVQIGESRGDTSRVTTFSLRSGKTAVSQVWTPGPLKGIWVGEGATPRLDFYPPPPPPMKLLGKMKLLGAGLAIGFGSCYLSDRVRD